MAFHLMEEPVKAALPAMLNNESLCFTKGMGEIKQYCTFPSTGLQGPKSVYYMMRHIFLLSLNQIMCGAEGRAFYTCFLRSRRDQNRKKLKLIHLKLLSTVLRHLQGQITSHCPSHSLWHLLKQHWAYPSADQFKLLK